MREDVSRGEKKRRTEDRTGEKKKNDEKEK